MGDELPLPPPAPPLLLLKQPSREDGVQANDYAESLVSWTPRLVPAKNKCKRLFCVCCDMTDR